MKNVNYVIEKLNSKKFKKNRSYSSREISSIIGLTDTQIVSTGALKDALKVHPEWRNEYGRTWMYLGCEKANLFNQPKIKTQVPNRYPQVKNNPKRREISLFWGLISIK